MNISSYIQVLISLIFWVVGLLTGLILWAQSIGPIDGDVLTLITGTSGTLVCLFIAIRFLLKYNERKDERIENMQKEAVTVREAIIAERQRHINMLDDQIKRLTRENAELKARLQKGSKQAGSDGKNAA